MRGDAAGATDALRENWTLTLDTITAWLRETG
jgi:hypothetical protein